MLTTEEREIITVIGEIAGCNDFLKPFIYFDLDEN